MYKFLYGCAFFGGVMLLLFVLTSQPPVLSTVEYSIDTERAVADREAQRLHDERMAEIERDRTALLAQQYTDRLAITALLVLGVSASFALAAASRRPAPMLETRDPYIIVESKPQGRLPG